MKHRLNIVLLMGVLFLSASASLYAEEPQKKGIGLWGFKGAERGLKNLGVTWFYDWGVEPVSKVHQGVEFVPMIWSEKQTTPRDLEKAKKSGNILLGFNEPDHKKQANMSVERALELWPQLEETGMRLGSPAPAGGATLPESWLGRFMKGAKAKGYRVDFICVHNYQENFEDPVGAAKNLKQFLEKVYELYQKPLWLTEFALANWKSPATPEQQEAYMKEVLPMLESLPFLERYAWFALPPNPKGDEGCLAGSNLCDEEGRLNGLGNVYGLFRK